MTGSGSLPTPHPDPADAVGPVGTAGPAEAVRRTVIVSGVASDSHTWNLIYLQMLVEELGYDVVNLGACVPDDLLVRECQARRPDLVVLSSVNGHGYQDGLRVVEKLRAIPALGETPIVIGGKLGVRGAESQERVGRLLAAGFDAVFDDRADAVVAFRGFAAVLPGRAVGGLL
ncbi:MAG: methylaspartate mutase [Catenulispora sp.]|nr:methylaspartate mutase [Catenulispora sp.]